MLSNSLTRSGPPVRISVRQQHLLGWGGMWSDASSQFIVGAPPFVAGQHWKQIGICQI